MLCHLHIIAKPLKGLKRIFLKSHSKQDVLSSYFHLIHDCWDLEECITKQNHMDQNLVSSEAISRKCFLKKEFLEISRNSQENTCARVSFLSLFIKKETLAQVFSSEFCEFFKYTFPYRAPPVAASLSCKPVRVVTH